MRSPRVIPAKAGISGREVTVDLHESPAFAGVTSGTGVADKGRVTGGFA